MENFKIIFDLGASKEQILSILKERQYLIDTWNENKTFIPIDNWKKLAIFETSETIVCIRDENIIPQNERILNFSYIVVPSLISNYIKLTSGIVMVLYFHFGNISTLKENVIESLLKNNVDNITSDDNGIYINGLKVINSYYETRSGFIIETMFININGETNISLNSIINIYPDFDKQVFLYNLQQEIDQDVVLYEDVAELTDIDDNLITNIPGTVDENIIPVYNTLNVSSVPFSDIIKLLIGRRIVDNLRNDPDFESLVTSELDELGFTVNEFEEFNKIICYKIYKQYRPITENYDDITKELLYKNRFELIISKKNDDKKVPEFNKNGLISFPFNIKWKI